MKIQTAFFSLLLLVALMACDKTNDPQIIANVMDEFRITPTEQLYPTERVFSLQFESIQLQDCENYAVVVDYKRTNRDILLLNIKDISLNGADCEEGRANAQGILDLGVLESGTYNVEIKLQDAIVNEGKLKVSDFDYQIEMKTDHGFELTHAQVLRVPTSTIWGYIGYTDVNGGPSTSIFDEFVSVLRDYTNDVELTPGYYGHFEWDGRTSADGTLSITIPNGTGLTFFRPFVFSYQNNISEIKALATRFQEQFEDPRLKIRLFTSEGDVFLVNNTVMVR